MAVSRTVWTFLDYLGKAPDLSVWATALTAGNFTAQMGLADTLLAAIEDVTLLNLKKDTRFAVETKFNPARPTDENAMKATKWLVSMVDTNGNSVTFHIPGADLSLLTGSNTLSLEGTEGAALVDAIEAYVKSNDGEAVTVQSITFVDK